jgi:hypothetical protein
MEADRGKWGRKPYASDCVIAVEIVSAVDTISPFPLKLTWEQLDDGLSPGQSPQLVN